MNSGKVFERQFRKCCLKDSELFYYRLKDSPSGWSNGVNSGVRFTNDNICDAFVFKSPVLFLLELKSHTGASLPFSCIRQNQIDGLMDASKHKNVFAGVICSFDQKQRCFFLGIQKVKELQDSQTRKSIPIKYFEENGIEIDVQKLRTNLVYDVSKFVKEIIEQGRTQ